VFYHRQHIDFQCVVLVVRYAQLEVAAVVALTGKGAVAALTWWYDMPNMRLQLLLPPLAKGPAGLSSWGNVTAVLMLGSTSDGGVSDLHLAPGRAWVAGPGV
jgi:hypothetical protein